MTDKKSNHPIIIAGMVANTVICAGFLFLCFIFFIHFSRGNHSSLVKAFLSLYAAILFVPVYGYLLSFLSIGAGHIARYIKAGIFVLRITVLIAASVSINAHSDKLRNDIASVLRLSASNNEMKELLGYMDSENWYELELGLDDIREQERDIDFIPLIAKNFELAIVQVWNNPPSTSAETMTQLIEGRLSYLSTFDSIQSAIPDYENSSLSVYLAPEVMASLLAAYGKFYLMFDYRTEAEEYFVMAMAINPMNPDVVLEYADAIMASNYLQDAAIIYQEYMRLMAKAGRDKDIPARVRKFVRSENYGESLQRKLFECWLTDAWNEIPEEYWNSYENREDYLRIGNRFYTSIRGGGHLVYELADCAAKLMGRNIEGKDPDLGNLEDLSGITVTDNSRLPFTDVNPKIVEWCRRNLIPDPDLKIFDHPCNRFYEIILQQSCRQKALGYAFLNSLLDVDEQAGEYKKLLYDQNFVGYEHLWRVIREPAGYVMRQDAEYWILQEETGFWLRRKIDGSYDECWKTLENILIKYDNDWYDYLWGGWIPHDDFDPGSDAEYEDEE